MKKAGAKTKGAKNKGQGTRKKSTERKARVRQVDIAAVRQKATNMIGGQATPMVKAVIEECKKGHYQVLKYLFEVAGIFPASAEASDEHEPSFAEILCQRLGLPEEMPSETDVANDSPETEVAVEHTVE